MIRSLFPWLRHASYICLGAYQRHYNAQWDHLLNQLLSEGLLLSCDAYRATFHHQGSEYQVWIANRWYAYGHMDNFNGEEVPREIQYRPRFRTMLRLHAVSSQTSEMQQADNVVQLRHRIYGAGGKQ
ncbi:MAG: hypothetical protein ACTINL_08685 [Serratia proteamaculans]